MDEEQLGLAREERTVRACLLRTVTRWCKMRKQQCRYRPRKGRPLVGQRRGTIISDPFRLDDTGIDLHEACGYEHPDGPRFCEAEMPSGRDRTTIIRMNGGQGCGHGAFWGLPPFGTKTMRGDTEGAPRRVRRWRHKVHEKNWTGCTHSKLSASGQTTICKCEAFLIMPAALSK